MPVVLFIVASKANKNLDSPTYSSLEFRRSPSGIALKQPNLILGLDSKMTCTAFEPGAEPLKILATIALHEFASTK